MAERGSIFDDVKRQVDLVEYLSEHAGAEFVSDGGDRLAARCPFHEEDTPSFKVSPEQLGTLREVIALLEFRISVETEAAALAAVRRQADNLQELRLALDEFSEAVEAGRDAVGADFRFHSEVARATQNHHFMDLMNSLGLGVIPRARLEQASPLSAERQAYLRRVNLEHESIYNAIAAQDVEAARAAMRTHLSNSRDRLRRGDAPST